MVLGKGIAEPGNPGKGSFRLGKQSRRPVAVVPAVEAFHRLLHAVGELLRVLQQLSPLLQSRILPRLQVRLLDLGNLVAQGLHPAQLLAFIHAHSVNLTAQVGNRPVFFAVVLPRSAGIPEGIQEAQMVILVEEGSGIMLAVDVNQLDSQLAQNGHGHQAPVDPADVFSVQKNLPLNHGFRVIVHPVFGKPGKFRHLGKHRPDGGLLGAGADHIPIGPLPQDGGDGIDDDGLTRAGFTGEHVEAPVKGDIRPLDHRDILNMQQTQHGSKPLSIMDNRRILI